MSRAYRDGIVAEVNALGGSGFDVSANVEKLSGADLAQARLAAMNRSEIVGDEGLSVDGDGTKELGLNDSYDYTPDNASLTGSDLVRYATKSGGASAAVEVSAISAPTFVENILYPSVTVGISYTIDGESVSPPFEVTAENSPVALAAVAESGYYIAEGVTAAWVFEYSA